MGARIEQQDHPPQFIERGGNFTVTVTFLLFLTGYLAGLFVLSFTTSIVAIPPLATYLSSFGQALLVIAIGIFALAGGVWATWFGRKQLGLHLFFVIINAGAAALIMVQPDAIAYFLPVPLVTPAAIIFLSTPRNGYFYLVTGLLMAAAMWGFSAILVFYLASFLILNGLSWLYFLEGDRAYDVKIQAIAQQEQQIRNLRRVISSAESEWNDARAQWQQVFELSHQLKEIREEEKLLREGVRHIRRIFKARKARLIMLDENGTPSTVYDSAAASTKRAALDIIHPATVLDNALHHKRVMVAQRHPNIHHQARTITNNQGRLDTPTLTSWLSDNCQIEVAAPLISNNSVIGLIHLQRSEFVDFSQSEKTYLQHVAQLLTDQMGIVRYFHVLEERSTHLVELQAIVTLMNEQANTQNALNVLAQRAREIVRAEISGIYLWNEAIDSLELAIVHGEDSQAEVQRKLQSIFTQVKSTFETADYGILTYEIPTAMEEGLKHVVTAPITAGEVPIGVLTLGRSNTQSIFAENEEQIVNLLAAQVGTIITNHQLIDETQTLARRERVLSQISAEIRRGLNVETVLQNAARQIGQSIESTQVRVQLHHMAEPE